MIHGPVAHTLIEIWRKRSIPEEGQGGRKELPPDEREI